MNNADDVYARLLSDTPGTRDLARLDFQEYTEWWQTTGQQLAAQRNADNAEAQQAYRQALDAHKAAGGTGEAPAAPELQDVPTPAPESVVHAYTASLLLDWLQIYGRSRAMQLSQDACNRVFRLEGAPVLSANLYIRQRDDVTLEHCSLWLVDHRRQMQYALPVDRRDDQVLLGDGPVVYRQLPPAGGEG